MHKASNSIVNIVKILEEDGIKTSRNSVSSFIARYKRTGSIDEAQRSGRKTIVSEEDRNFIDERMKDNDELTSWELQKLLRDERGVTISTSTIRNVRRKLGWKHEKARYCQLIRDRNKTKRLVFSLKALKEQNGFEDVIFTDETSVEIQQYTRYCFRKNGSVPKRKGKPKHPLKVSISKTIFLTFINFVYLIICFYCNDKDTKTVIRMGYRGILKNIWHWKIYLTPPVYTDASGLSQEQLYVRWFSHKVYDIYFQVHVWAGISYKGATNICIFTGHMESIGYQTILKRNLLTFIKSQYPQGHRFWQDNDPKHTSNSTKLWMKTNGINHWHTPPESPVCTIDA